MFFLEKIGRKILSNIMNGQGLTLIEKKQYNYAQTEFARAIKMNPNNVDAHFNLGKVLSEQNLEKEAIAEFDKVIELNPKYADAYRWRSVSKLELDDIEGALADCLKASAIKPSSDIESTLGGIYVKAGKFEDAEKTLLKAIESNPKNSAAYANLGRCYLEQDKGKEAYEAFQNAVKLNTKSDYLYSLFAEAAEKIGELKEAADLYTRAGFLDQQNAEYRCAVARVSEAADDIEGAVLAYQEAVKLDPECLPALKCLCEHAFELGDKDKAISYLQRLTDAHKDSWQADYCNALSAIFNGDNNAAFDLLKKALTTGKAEIAKEIEKGKLASFSRLDELKAMLN